MSTKSESNPEETSVPSTIFWGGIFVITFAVILIFGKGGPMEWMAPWSENSTMLLGLLWFAIVSIGSFILAVVILPFCVCLSETLSRGISKLIPALN